MAQLRIIHTTDLHGRLSASQARRLAELKAEHQALLLDSGDALTAPNVLVWPWAERVLGRMNEAGYDAMVAGNREYFFRLRGLLHKTAPARFPVLSVNLHTAAGRPALLPQVILESPQGDSVGVLGIGPQMIAPESWAERFSDLRFVPWLEETRRLAEGLRGQVDWLVALAHLSRQDTLRLAQACGDLDLILGGHPHLRSREHHGGGKVEVTIGAPYLRSVALVTSTGLVRPDRFEVEALQL